MYTVFRTIKSRSFRVLWALEELGVEYEHVPSMPRSDEVIALNGSGKIPAFRHDDAVLTDSTAILTYLADNHGKLTHPAGSVVRAQQDAMTGRILDEFDAVLWAAAKHSFILPEDKRVPAVKDSLKWEFNRNAERLVRELGEQGFLAGDEITIPDILLTHCLGWAMIAKFGVSDPNLSAYFDRMRGRMAYKAAQKNAAG